MTTYGETMNKLAKVRKEDPEDRKEREMRNEFRAVYPTRKERL
jgi:hypothetical protein